MNKFNYESIEERKEIIANLHEKIKILEAEERERENQWIEENAFRWMNFQEEELKINGPKQRQIIESTRSNKAIGDN